MPTPSPHGRVTVMRFIFWILTVSGRLCGAPAPLSKCPECGHRVFLAHHRWTRRCLLNQVDKTSVRGFGGSGNGLRRLCRLESFQDFCRYVITVALAWENRPRGSVASPFVPLIPWHANDAQLMIELIKRNLSHERITNKRRILAACVCVAYGFTSLMAAIVCVPPVPWNPQYEKYLKHVLSMAHSLNWQIMNVGVLYQCSLSVLRKDTKSARVKIDKIIASLRTKVGLIAKMPEDIFREKGSRWLVATALEHHKHPYLVTHALQFASQCGCWTGEYSLLPGEPITFAGGCVRGIQEILGVQEIPLQWNSALVRLTLEVIQKGVHKTTKHKIPIGILEVLVCQARKDGFSLKMTDVFQAGLTTTGSLEKVNDYWRKRDIMHLVDLATEDIATLKRMRVR